jgi:hypothetical protein
MIEGREQNVRANRLLPRERGCELHSVLAAQSVVPLQASRPLHQGFRGRHTDTSGQSPTKGPPCCSAWLTGYLESSSSFGHNPRAVHRTMTSKNRRPVGKEELDEELAVPLGPGLIQGQ